MKTKIITNISLLFSLFLGTTVSAQDSVKKPEIKLTYERPSMSQVYLMGRLQQDSKIYEGFNSINGLPDNRADYNNIGFPYISGDVDFSDENYQKNIAPQLQKYFNQVVAYYWSRDAQGNFSDKLIGERGNFTATDNQVLTDKASEISRTGDLGYSLIDKSYIFVYDIISLRTYEEIYNEKDADRRKSVENHNKNLKSGQAAKEFTPVARVKQGWEIKYAVSIYKLKWSKDIQNDFYSNYWVDASTTEGRSQKIAGFNSKNFEYTYVSSFKSIMNETKMKASSTPVSQEIMNALLLSSAKSIQSLALSGVEDYVEDFRLRANVFSSYPIRAKLGTKESLHKEDRYFLYELTENDLGEIEKNRIGWAYVTKVAKNNKMADGEMPTSKFKQHGGKKIYSGVLMEERNDIGLVVNLGKGIGNQFYQGVNFGLELNTSKIVSIVPGLYLGANLTYGSGSKLNLGEMVTNNFFYDSLSADNMSYTDRITYADSNYSTTKIGLNIYIGKEFYFLRTGNLTIFPTAGVSYNAMSITKRNGEYIYSTYEYDDNDPFSFTSINAYLSVAVGYNLTPGLNVYVEPIVSRRGAMQNDFGVVQQISTDSNVNKAFSDLNYSPMLINVGVRFRL